VRKLLAREPEVPRPASSARSARCSGPHREGAEHLRADHGLRPGDGLGLDLAILEHRLDDEIDRGDVGAILGFGYAPYTGGPLSWIDMMGAKSFVELCNALEKHGPRFKPTKPSCSSTWRPRAIPFIAAPRGRVAARLFSLASASYAPFLRACSAASLFIPWGVGAYAAFGSRSFSPAFDMRATIAAK